MAVKKLRGKTDPRSALLLGDVVSSSHQYNLDFHKAHILDMHIITDGEDRNGRICNGKRTEKERKRHDTNRKKKRKGKERKGKRKVRIYKGKGKER